MNSVTRFKILAATCGALLWSASAQAGSWGSLADGTRAVSAATLNDFVYILNANSYAGPSGYRLYQKNLSGDYNGDYDWHAVGSVSGTSITVAWQAIWTVFLVSGDNNVYRIGTASAQPSVTAYPSNNCGGGAGSLRPSQRVGRNNLAVTPGYELFVITDSGQVRHTNGTYCWDLLPALPTGKALDIASNSYGWVWVASNDEKVYKWTGSAWEWIPAAGAALGVSGNRFELGTDGWSVWRFNGTVVAPDPDWLPSYGPLKGLGMSFRDNVVSHSWSPTGVAIGADNRLFLHYD